jgi:putative hydrolase of the HAD superfamily
LEQEKLLSYFPLRIYSCQVGIRKPNRRIFEIALETLGLPASEVIFVGDSLKADVKGSSKAGMYSIYKTPDRPPIKISEKIRSVSSLDQIPAIIKELNKNQ